MIKKFPHAVIWNGEFVRANTPIEVADEPEQVEKVADEATDEKPKRKGGRKNDKAGDRES